MRNRTLSLFTAAVIGSTGFAGDHSSAQVFDFKDPKGVNSVSFLLDAPLEQISGNAKGVSGEVHYHADDLSATKGKIVVATKSLTVTNDLMEDHMLGDGWLDAEKYPEITFEVNEIKDISKTEKGFEGTAIGDFTLKGTTKSISVPISFVYLEDMLGKRTNGKQEGDLLVLRSEFSINRSEYGIKPGQSTDKVADDVEIQLAIAGSSPKE